ncbi:MAG: hypothetical protein ACJ73E_07995 [Mycobacteriales bacterium]
MSEPTYGSGPAYDPQQGYGGGTPGYGQPGQQYGQPGQQYGSGQQPQQPPYAAYGQQQPGPGGYPSGYQGAPAPAAPRTPADRLGLAATVVTIVGYVCAGAGVLGFILWLTVSGDGTYRFATALQTLVVGIGLGGLNYALGSWLGTRSTTSS